MSDDAIEPVGIQFVKWIYEKRRQSKAGSQDIDDDAQALMASLVDGILSEPLGLVIGDLQSHYGYHAFQDALRHALEMATAKPDRRGGRPPAAVSRAKRQLEPFLRGPGRPGGNTIRKPRADDGRRVGPAAGNPDAIHHRDDVWLAVAEHLAQRGMTFEQIAEHIHARENPDRYEPEWVRERLTRLRRLKPRERQTAAANTAEWRPDDPQDDCE